MPASTSPRPPITPILIDHTTAARLLSLSPRSLRIPGFRAKHGIPFVKVGALVRFEEQSLRDYVASRRINTTAATVSKPANGRHG